MEYHQKALLIYEELGDKDGIEAIYGGIANIYRNLANYEPALEYLYQSLEVLEELGSKQGVSTTLRSIGMTYLEQGKNRFAEEKRSL